MLIEIILCIKLGHWLNGYSFWPVCVTVIFIKVPTNEIFLKSIRTLTIRIYFIFWKRCWTLIGWLWFFLTVCHQKYHLLITVPSSDKIFRPSVPKFHRHTKILSNNSHLKDRSSIIIFIRCSYPRYYIYLP